jgi:hypothetical protein
LTVPGAPTGTLIGWDRGVMEGWRRLRRAKAARWT